MNVPKIYENVKWEDVPQSIRDGIAGCYKTGRGLYIHGPVGVGKTHIAWAIKKQHDGPRVYKFAKYWNVVDLMHEIKSDFDRSPYDKRRPEEALTDRDFDSLLILDDIGAEKATDFVAETLYRIINHRYINVLPTIFTSNLPIAELAERIGERSASRIVGMCEIIELTGADRRLQ